MSWVSFNKTILGQSRSSVVLALCCRTHLQAPPRTIIRISHHRQLFQFSSGGDGSDDSGVDGGGYDAGRDCCTFAVAATGTIILQLLRRQIWPFDWTTQPCTDTIATDTMRPPRLLFWRFRSNYGLTDFSSTPLGRFWLELARGSAGSFAAPVGFPPNFRRPQNRKAVRIPNNLILLALYRARKKTASLSTVPGTSTLVPSTICILSSIVPVPWAIFTKP